MENEMKPLGMTLRQLLSCVNFENIVPVILSDPGAGLTLAQYKQAFDILLHTEGYPDGEWDKDGYSQYCLGEVEWKYINHHR